MALDLSMISEFLTVEFLFSAISVLGGTFFAFDHWWSYKIAKQTVKWPKTKGTILYSRVTESWRIRRGRRGIMGRERIYSPKIDYSYNVNDQIYHSSQIFIGSEGYSTKSRIHAYHYIRKYPKGEKVMVHYNRNIYQLPAKEKYSVLETGVKYPIYIGLFFGTVFGIAGCVMFVQYYSTVGVFSSIGCVLLGRQLDMWLRRRKKRTHSKREYPTSFKK